MTQQANEITAATSTIDYNLPCPRCAYNLKGVPTSRCPECGHTLSASELLPTKIPWVHRTARGRVRTFVQTLWIVTFRTHQICDESDRHVSYAHAQRFRWVTVMLLYLPWLIFEGVLVAIGEGQALDILRCGDVLGVVVTQAVIHGCHLLFLAAATGLPSLFFHPRFLPIEKQNRGIALSYYMCGVLSWLLLAYMTAVITTLFTWQLGTDFATLLGGSILGGSVLLVSIYWAFLECKLGNRILGPRRAWTIRWLLLPLWILLAVGILVVLPAMLLPFALIYTSVT